MRATGFGLALALAAAEAEAEAEDDGAVDTAGAAEAVERSDAAVVGAVFASSSSCGQTHSGPLHLQLAARGRPADEPFEAKEEEAEA